MSAEEALGPFDHEHAARGSGREPWTYEPPPGCTKVVVTNLAGVGVGSPAFLRLDGVPASVGRGSLPVLPETSRVLVVGGPVSIVGGPVDLHPIVEAAGLQEARQRPGRGVGGSIGPVSASLRASTGRRGASRG